MPPYSKNVSKAEQRMKFRLASQGRMSMEDAIGSARATKRQKGGYAALPEHVSKKKATRKKRRTGQRGK